MWNQISVYFLFLKKFIVATDVWIFVGWNIIVSVSDAEIKRKIIIWGSEIQKRQNEYCKNIK